MCLPRRFNPDVKFPNFVRTVAIDSHGTDLNFITADRKVQLDNDTIVFDPHDGLALSQNILPEITDAVAGLDMVILVSAMGGTIGTTATPIVARQFMKLGVLTLAIVLMPYPEEGVQRHKTAAAGLQTLRGEVNALLPVFNNEFDDFDPNWHWWNAYLLPQYIDALYGNIVKPLCVPGWVNVEFSDVRDITLNQTGMCAFGHGLSCGKNAAQQAVVNAIELPPLGKSRLQQARSALFTFEHGRDVLQSDIKLAIQSIRSHLSPDCHFIYGVSVSNSHSDMVQFNILANGIPQADPRLV
jgi:cell division protein FtsZ